MWSEKDSADVKDKKIVFAQERIKGNKRLRH
jgi:hypothetical protein